MMRETKYWCVNLYVPIFGIFFPWELSTQETGYHIGMIWEAAAAGSRRQLHGAFLAQCYAFMRHCVTCKYFTPRLIAIRWICVMMCDWLETADPQRVLCRVLPAIGNRTRPIISLLGTALNELGISPIFDWLSINDWKVGVSLHLRVSSSWLPCSSLTSCEMTNRYHKLLNKEELLIRPCTYTL